MGQIYNKIKIQNTNFIPKFFMATINFWHGVYYDRYTCIHVHVTNEKNTCLPKANDLQVSSFLGLLVPF